MEFRQLGRSDIRIAPLVLGGNVFGWNVDAKTSFAILDAFIDAGFNAIDTADSYSRWAPGHVGGESETIIGKWLKQSGKRDKVVILTKFGEDMGEGRSTRKDYMQRAAQASLRRLQTDRIDLYQTHFDDEMTPVEETMAGFAQLIAAGKVRAAGASNVSPKRFEASLEASKRLGLPRYESLQPLYNLSDRNEFESGYAAICRKAKDRRHPLLRARRRLPHRQIPLAAGCRQEPKPRRPAEEISQPAGIAHPRRHRQGRRQAPGDLRAGVSGLADRENHRADRQCHQP